MQVDAVVVGAGVIGIAVARELAMSGREVFLLDGESMHGSWTSSRNSEVIHAGIYYQPGSAKAALCVAGKALLYDFCARNNVPHKRTGKLIFGRNEAQLAALEDIRARATAAGVSDLVLLSGAEVRSIEPDLTCHSALLSPSTGIVDSHGLMAALLGEAEAHETTFVANTQVQHVARRQDVWNIHIVGTEGPAVTAAVLVNAAGLGAQRLAHNIAGLEPKHVPALHLARGVYFSYAGKTPFSHLIYPVPEDGGLGLHLTLDMGGQARFGPDVEWIDTVDYRIDEARKPAFVEAARAIWPAIDPERLQPAYSGIRPKLNGPGEPAADFVISGPADHGLPGLVNLFGIESPGLTASLAIARQVGGMLQ